MVDSWPDESTIIWCHYNAEQDQLATVFPDAANIDGSTPFAERERLIDDFKAGRRKVLLSKGKRSWGSA
jgi:superfamily II DNA or RNA helicase